MKNVQYKSFNAQLSEDGNYVEGYASTYGNIDRGGDIIEKGAFTKTLSQRSTPVRFLWQHDASRPIGVIEKWEDRAEGLWFKARFANTTDGRDARENFASGTIDKFSIGFIPVIQKADKIGNRRVNRIKEVALWEVSAVTFPANEMATMTAIKSADPKGELSEENRALLVQLAEQLLIAQGAASTTPEIAPETPVEGEEAPQGSEDAAIPEEAAADAPEGEQHEEAVKPAEEAAPEGEKAPEKPVSEEEDEEDDAKKAKKKSLDDAIESFRIELAFKRALGR